ncbi:hypothetical protein [Bradyrhizobium sp. 930_D9_N1_4]|uniref:hypothetical protein n=1 Tax=Bradyrhizobium sp. 930_D9_N1_4 TaxID=3240374 RepID=UPI003F8AAB63
MAHATVPSAEQIIDLYGTGELAAELARYHEDSEEPFVQRCIELHNEKKINLVEIPTQPGFKEITGHDFFTAQHFYCEAIPKLDADVAALMECCQALVEQAGMDGAAGQPNEAFRLWCQNNPAGGARVISKAREGDSLAKRFVTFALQASESMETAADFVQSYDDERRLFGMAALGRMPMADESKARQATQVLEPFLAAGDDDNVRANALSAAFDVLKKYNDVDEASDFIGAATDKPGPATLHALAQIIWLHYNLMSSQTIEKALVALQAIQSDHKGTLRSLDFGLHQLLAGDNRGAIIDFLTTKLRDDKITLEDFPTTAGELKRGNRRHLYEIIVRWLLSGSQTLSDNVGNLIAFEDKNPFDASIVVPSDLTAVHRVFLCRKAIGILFTRPVTCCSILVSVLRGGDKEVIEEVVDLLFEPMLVNYSGKALDYLRTIAVEDPAHASVQMALERHQAYFAGLEKPGPIKELHPSDYQRDVVRQRTYDEMRAAQKSAEQQSVLFSVVHRSTLLYGKRSLTYVFDDDGGRRPVSLDLHSVGVSFEMPRQDVLDPVGLDFMLRVFRVEKMQ